MSDSFLYIIDLVHSDKVIRDQVNNDKQWIAAYAGSHPVETGKNQPLATLPALNLPTTYPRGETAGRALVAYPFTVTKPFIEQGENWLGPAATDLSALFLTVYLIVLHRYTNQEAIGVGLITGQGAHYGLLADLAAQTSARALLQQVAATVQHAIGQKGASGSNNPLPLLCNQPGANGQPPVAPVQAWFSANAPATAAWLQTNPGTGVELAFLVETAEAACTATLLYHPDHFAPATIAQMARHIQVLLTGLIADPTQAIARLPLLTAAESRQLLVEWNQTAAAYPDHLCIHQLLEQQAARTPDAVAVAFGAEQLTYGELHGRANQLARHLINLGVTPDDLVGIYVERSVEMVVGLLGILKAGGAYVPLDPHFPAERLTFMLADANAHILLTTAQLLTPLRHIVPTDQAYHFVCLDTLPSQPVSTPLNTTVSDWTTIAREQRSAPVTAVQPAHLAYCIYTSGSTGKPKGVEVEHRTVVNFLMAMRHEPGLTDQDVLLAVTTISFDIAGLELYLPLLVGAKIVLTSRTIAATGPLLAQLINDSAATVMQATPATWQLLLASGWPGQPGLKMLCGGEALPQALADQLLTKGATLWNLYGPTETTIWSTAYAVTRTHAAAEQARDLPEPIGRPIANTAIYLLNPQGQPVPVGVPGDLYIGGAGLARGYRHRPELTAERFIPNPFGPPVNPGRLYKTGDVARYRIDGKLEFLGRSDHQVKIRGFRIELGEIEAALLRHPLVREVVVAARQDDAATTDKRLVAYVVLTPQPTEAKQAVPPVAARFRAYLAAQLPDYMIPAHFVVLSAMPLTPNGKINRLALPAPASHRPTITTQLVVPQTKIEQLIAKTWQETLRLETVGIHDNFFELGGNSLLLTQTYAKLLQDESLHGQVTTDLSTTTLLEYPTIYTLAQFINQRATLTKAGAPARQKPPSLAPGNGESEDKQSDRRSRRAELVERRGQRARR